MQQQQALLAQPPKKMDPAQAVANAADAVPGAGGSVPTPVATPETTPSPQEPGAAGGMAAQAPMGQPAPGLPGVKDFTGEINKAAGAEQEAELAHGRAEAHALEAKGALGEQHAQERTNLVASQQKEWADHLAEVAKMRQDVAAGKIDPNRYLSSRSTGQKISNAIGLILGGIGGGMTHSENPVIGIIENKVKEDIAAQTANLDTKKGLLSNLMEKGHDLQTAQKLAYANLMDVQAAHMEGQAAKSGSDIAKAQSALNSSVIGAKTVAARQEAYSQKFSNQEKALAVQQAQQQVGLRPVLIAAENGAVVPGQWGAMLPADRRVKVPGGWTLANTSKDRDEVVETNQALSGLRSAIKNVRNLSGTVGLGGTDTKKGALAVTDLQNAYQAILGRSNAPRGKQEEQLSSALSNPTNFWRSSKGINEMMDLMEKIGQRHAAAALGARLSGGLKAAQGVVGG